MGEQAQRLALGVEYDGREFVGWQSQPGLASVEAALAAAVGAVADHSVELVCAGRTDAGVHATGQVVHVDVRARRSLRSWLLGINANLPSAASVGWVQPVPPWFHARFSAQARHYRYLVWNRRAPHALARGRMAHVREPLDPSTMQRAADILVGEHDFSAFRAAECQARSPVRRLMYLRVSRRDRVVAIDAVANAFLHHMVRNIAGLLIDVGQGRVPVGHVRELLAARDRRLAPPTAPADGLYLAAVDYPSAFELPRSVADGEDSGRSAMIPGL